MAVLNVHEYMEIGLHFYKTIYLHTFIKHWVCK